MAEAEQYHIDVDDDPYPLEEQTEALFNQDSNSSLPSKPTGIAPPETSQLSYSAQVAKQFSAYQQTPSQERQQRKEIPLPPNPRASGRMNPFTTSAAKTYVNSGGTVFGKKPSEMHDHG
jgi:RNA-binding protein Musashi